MPLQERRLYPRFKFCNVRAKLSSLLTQSQEGNLINISQAGAYLKGCGVPEPEATVTLHPYRGKKLEKKCSIVRTDEQRQAWSAIKFNNQLTPIEMEHLQNMGCPGTAETYELAKRDHEEVCQELCDIKSCRSNIFVWTVWILATAALGILTFMIQFKIGSFALIGNFLTLVVIAIMFGVFMLGVLTAIEKAGAINLREGFLAALDFYLSKNQGPQEYKGWTHLKNCIAECMARCRTQMCPRRTEANAHFTRCRNEGENNAAKLNSGKRIIPMPIDSFTSLTSYVHSAIFGALVILFCLSLSANFSSVVRCRWTCLLFVGGFAFNGVISGKLKRIYKLSIIVGIGIIVAFCVWRWPYPVVILRLALAFGLGLLLGSLAWHLVNQLHHARVGRYSFETYTHTWFAILEHCISIPNDWQQGQYCTHRKLRRKVLDWLLNCESPGGPGADQDNLLAIR